MTYQDSLGRSTCSQDGRSLFIADQVAAQQIDNNLTIGLGELDLFSPSLSEFDREFWFFVHTH
jgi:hypothetical protein